MSEDLVEALRKVVVAAEARLYAEHDDGCEYLEVREDDENADELEECDCGYARLAAEVKAIGASGVLG